MTPAFLLRQVLREFRGSSSRLLYFTLCLAVGVAAVVLVAGLSRSLDQGIRGEARALLAADLAVRGNRRPPPELVAAADELAGSRRSLIQETVTIVAVRPPEDELRMGGGPQSLLVELKVIDGPYPFYGDLLIEPAEPLSSLLGPDGVVVARGLLPRLDLALGDALMVGGEPFTIRGLVVAEPDRIGGSLSIGPRVFVSRAGMRRTPLDGFGSQVDYKLLIALPAGTTLAELRAAKEHLEAAIPPNERFRVETYEEAQPALRRGLSRLEHYLGLIALLSLLVGGVGVGQAIRSWVSSRLDAIAILKCIGVRPREAMALYLGQALLLGIGGSLVGAILGTGILALMPMLLADLVPSHMLRAWQPTALPSR